MINVEKRASAHLPTAATWLGRGETLAKTLRHAVEAADGWLNRTFDRLARAQARRAARRELYALDDRLLADIGLRRDQVSECVDAMFRGGSDAPRESAAVVAASEDITEINVSNDDQYKTAA